MHPPRVWKWETGSRPVASCQNLGLVIPAHWLALRPHVFGQALTRASRLDPGWFCTIWSMPSLEEWNWIGCIHDLAWFWLHTGNNPGTFTPLLANNEKKFESDSLFIMHSSLPKTLADWFWLTLKWYAVTFHRLEVRTTRAEILASYKVWCNCNFLSA